MEAADQAYCMALHDIENHDFAHIERFYSPEEDDEEPEWNQSEGIQGSGEAG